MIKGITPQLAERGKIKIGEKGELKTSAQGKQFAQPKKLDHFQITTMRRDQAGRLLPDAELMKRLAPAGGKLTEIPVRLLYDDVDLNFSTRYACYKGNRCWCTGDGETAQRLKGENAYEGVACPCPRQDPFYTGQDRCKVLGTLQCLIEGVDRVGGVWKFRTTSWNTVNAILSSLHFMRTITGGALARIPLWLVMDPKTVTVPTTGKAMVVYVVRLEYRGTEQELADLGYDIARRRIENRVRMEDIERAARAAQVLPQLEAPEEQADTAAEFFPEAVDIDQLPTGAPEPPPARDDAEDSPAEQPGNAPAWIPEEERSGEDLCPHCDHGIEGMDCTCTRPEPVKGELVTCPKCAGSHPGPQQLCQGCLDKMHGRKDPEPAKKTPPKPPAERRKSTRQAMEEAKQVFEGAKEGDQGGLF